MVSTALLLPRPLLHYHRQVHTRVDGAIQMVGPSGVEWPNCLAFVAIDPHIDGRRARFCGLCGGSLTIPETIANDVCRSCVRDQVEAAPLANGDRRLHEAILCHVYVSTPTLAGAHTALLGTPRHSPAPHHQHRDNPQAP